MENISSFEEFCIKSDENHNMIEVDKNAFAYPKDVWRRFCIQHPGKYYNFQKTDKIDETVRLGKYVFRWTIDDNFFVSVYFMDIDNGEVIGNATPGTPLFDSDSDKELAKLTLNLYTKYK